MEKNPICVKDGCYEPKMNLEWGDGPWKGEPDRVDFMAYGLPCFVHRNIHRDRKTDQGTGSWCGYVGVPTYKHPAYGKHFGQLDVKVHGGLTFSQKCNHGHLCHGGAEKRPVQWFGFDCSHTGDYSPAIEALLNSLSEDRAARPLLPGYNERKWSVEEVITETKRLAKQLATLTGKKVRGRSKWSKGWGRRHKDKSRRMRALKIMNRDLNIARILTGR